MCRDPGAARCCPNRAAGPAGSHAQAAEEHDCHQVMEPVLTSRLVSCGRLALPCPCLLRGIFSGGGVTCREARCIITMWQRPSCAVGIKLVRGYTSNVASDPFEGCPPGCKGLHASCSSQRSVACKAADVSSVLLASSRESAVARGCAAALRCSLGGDSCACCSNRCGSERLVIVLQVHSAAGPHQVGAVPWQRPLCGHHSGGRAVGQHQGHRPLRSACTLCMC